MIPELLPTGVTVEARFLCAAHIGDRIDVDYTQLWKRTPITVTGRLWMISATNAAIHLYLEDSDQVASDDPVVLDPTDEVTVTTR